MQELKKKLFYEMFFLVYGFESMRTISQNWLADITEQLKVIYTTLENAVVVFGFY